MADEPKEPIVEKKVDKPVIKSWSEMRKEAKTQAREKYAKKLLGEVKKDEKPQEPSERADEKPAREKVIEPKEPKVDYNEVARKAAKEAADEAATRVATETKEAFKSEVQKILDKDKSLVDKQKELDDLIPVYIKENRLPKDYQEMVQEQLRVTEAKWQQKENEKIAKAQEDKANEPPTPPVNQDLQAYQKQITDDLSDLYDAKFLPKPTSIDEINNPDTTDPNAKETQKLLDFGVKLNVQRKANNLPPITSLNKIYFMHYKPELDAKAKKDDQPPGADAPVSPSRSQQTTDFSKPRPFYQKGEDGHMHAKSWAQIRYEALKSRVNRPT